MYTLKISEQAYAHKGELDLTDTLFADSKLVSLDGEWEFYKDQLLTPQDFKNNSEGTHSYIKVPGSWSKDTKGKPINSKGAATYRLLIKNVPQSATFGIKKQNIRSACRIFVNGKLVLEEGKPSVQLKDYVAKNNPQLIFFGVDHSEVELVIQVSNYSYISSGIASSIYFGEQPQLLNFDFKKSFFEIAIIITLLTIGVVYLLLLLFVRNYHKKEPSILAFALSCIFFSVFNMCIGERTILHLFPSLPYVALFKLKDTAVFLSNLCFFTFISQISYTLLSIKLRKVLFVVYSSYILTIIFTSIEFYNAILPIFFVLNLGIYLKIFFQNLYFYIKGRYINDDLRNHTVIFIGLFSNIIYTFDIIFYSIGITKDMTIGFVSIVLYAISLTLLLTLKIGKSYNMNDYLAEELAINEQAFLQAQIKPHFLFNALSSVISLCYKDSREAAKLLNYLSSYLRRSFEFNYQNEFVTIESELALVQTYLEIEKTRFGDELHIEYEIDQEILDKKVIPISIQPLVENAVIHGINQKEAGGTIHITVQKKASEIFICVSDNGVGMSINPLNLDDQEENQSGVGLNNINKRLQKYYNKELHIESSPETGTKVYFEIPIA